MAMPEIRPTIPAKKKLLTDLAKAQMFSPLIKDTRRNDSDSRIKRVVFFCHLRSFQIDLEKVPTGFGTNRS
jgi:hypothetical protein